MHKTPIYGETMGTERFILDKFLYFMDDTTQGDKRDIQKLHL